MKKYELTTEIKIWSGRKLYRIKALIDFKSVKAGDLGGWIEKEENLSHSDNAWVCGDACVYGDAWVCGDADYTTIKGFGSEYRTSTFFRCKDGRVKVSCGCFLGTIDEFRAKVKVTHKDSKKAKEYLMIAELMEYHFAEDNVSEE